MNWTSGFELQEYPSLDQGSAVQMFTDLYSWTGIRNVIEQTNHSAIAA